MSNFGRLLEKKIRVKIKAIAKGTETIQNANVNSLLDRLSLIDEASAEELKKTYIATVKNLGSEE